jgi:opacity protein-like surface antigen
MQIGYDDNTLQSPTKSEAIPAITQEVLVQPAQPGRFVEVPNIVTRIVEVRPGVFEPVQVVEGTRLEFQKGQNEKFETVVLQEEIPKLDRIGSFFIRASANYEITFGSRRTVFTMDLSGNADYYFSRPNDQTDLTGSISFNYLYRVTPRMTFSATASVALLAQPDVRILNAPTQNVGDYYSVTSRFNLSYQWAKRFSTVSSFSFNSILYSDSSPQRSNFAESTLGTEARFRWSARFTALVDGRYSLVRYSENPVLDASTAYLLLGAEYAFTSRLSATLRLGGSLRTFENLDTSTSFDGEDTATTPYMEGTVSWRYAPTGFLTLNSRFGFEEPPGPQSEVIGARTGISAIQAFSARVRGSAGVTYINRTTTTEGVDEEFSEQTLDLQLGLQYAFSSRFSLNASYTYTQTFSNNEVSDYYRNRIFIGGEYTF